MHPVYDATLNVARDSFAMLREAVDGLPGEAMDWKPAENANSLNVLTVHSITATLFWIRAGAGEQVSLAGYREEERGPSFASKGRSSAEMVAAIDTCLADIEGILARADSSTLEGMREWAEDPSMSKDGTTCLVHSLGHLREHVGQAQLTRDLWLSQHA